MKTSSCFALAAPAALSVVMLTGACGRVADEASVEDASSVQRPPGPDGPDSGLDSRRTDAPEDEGPDANLGLHCEADGGTTAPSGGACDPTRLVVVRGGAGACFGLHSFCDIVQVRVADADAKKLPPGFTCGAPYAGRVVCVYSLPAGHEVDAPTLDAACAVTTAIPDATLECIILD